MHGCGRAQSDWIKRTVFIAYPRRAVAPARLLQPTAGPLLADRGRSVTMELGLASEEGGHPAAPVTLQLHLLTVSAAQRAAYLYHRGNHRACRSLADTGPCFSQARCGSHGVDVDRARSPRLIWSWAGSRPEPRSASRPTRTPR
jgi:hypothetical protein